jgi:hypothetical protein
MSKIKSALELALERTAAVPVDKDAVRKEEFIRKGKVAAGRFLSDPKSVSLPDELNSADGTDRASIKSGMVETFLANITLPRYETDLARFPVVADALKSIAEKKGSNLKNLEHILSQYSEFFKQYLENLDKLEEQLRARWEPRLRQKEQLHKQKTGQTVRLTAERDPEFAKILNEEMARIDLQYNEMLSQGKEEIRKLV